MTPKHDAETSTRVAAEITSNHEKSSASQTSSRRRWNPAKSVESWSTPAEKFPSNQDPREVCVEVATVPQNPERSLASQRRRCWNPVKSTAGRKFRQSKPEKISSNRRTPKNHVNSTPVPALVPSQCDGSGGPRQ